MKTAESRTRCRMPMPVFVILGHSTQHQTKGNIIIDNQSCSPLSLIDALTSEKDVPLDTVNESVVYYCFFMLVDSG